MSNGLKRPPVHFRAAAQDGTSRRYGRMSKADWADVFADMVEEYMGEGIQGSPATPTQILDEAERRLGILKQNGIR
jgi:hypothetical protein